MAVPRRDVAPPAHVLRVPDNRLLTCGLSFVYPIARGSAPVIVLVVALAVLDESATAAQVVGVLVIAAGVLLVRGVGGHATLGDLA